MSTAIDVLPRILIIDDDQSLLESYTVLLEDEFQVSTAETGEKGLDLLRHEDVHLVLLDVRLPGINGIEVLRRIKALDENVDVIMITAVKDVRVAVEAIKLGAYDYLEKPFEIDEILSLLRRTLEHQNLLREVLYLRDLRTEADRYSIVGRSPKMHQIYDLIARVADTSATVLISGESGVGKELIARALHQQSQRRLKPFVAVNCAAISEHLVESELFGHERGAFTGAVEMHRGKFELAHTGTLFLDEVGSLRLDLQAKLLRVLQEREFERVGGGKTIRMDVRIVAASNQDLRQMVADRTFREMYEKFPLGHYAERAAWKIGWWAYKNGNYADTVRVFESAAANFPRSDFRPPWLYWSARAHDRLNEPAIADARYTLVATDYLNTYYGRLAAKHLTDRGSRLPQRRLVVDVRSTSAPPGADDRPQPLVQLPPNEHVVRALLALDLYDQAIDELRYAQKAWGDSSAIQATLAWIANQRGDLRAGINAMKRAYPQFMAAGGEKLPIDILKVLYPVNYWPLIRRYSNERQLDPYLVAALIAQESTFTADVRSAANAYGLMQLLPSTGRQYARALKLPKRFSLSMLTTAETNIKMGTAYFADLVRQFGGAHYALATYNAGPNRVARWISERPGVERDEFIDDIPFPETQNYVKRILGTAEDYRRLYGSESAVNGGEDATPAVSHQAQPAPAQKASAAKAPAKKKPAVKAPAKKKKSTSRKAKKAA